MKWPGGKTRELARIRPLVPAHSLYVEPFVGGGALFFDLEPAEAHLGDASRELTDFYRAVKARDPDLRAALDSFARDRERLRERAASAVAGFEDLVAVARTGRPDLFSGAFVRELAGTDLEVPAAAEIERGLPDKARRLARLERKHEKTFAPEELPDHLETALMAAYYTAIRDRYEPTSRSAQVARFFFLREFCYGSMFRYSKSGRFNIPYGGISYNRIRLARKVERLFSPEVGELLDRATIVNGDFSETLDAVRDRLPADGFVFLDPPYDTEFSGYANRAFGREDHERLAAAFAGLPCPALLVIQRTDFVLGLYEGVGRARRERGEPFFLRRYGKTYGYNVRGRNDRSATHLLVGNYDPPRGRRASRRERGG